jgi:hypothetical protein
MDHNIVDSSKFVSFQHNFLIILYTKDSSKFVSFQHNSPLILYTKDYESLFLKILIVPYVHCISSTLQHQKQYIQNYGQEKL